VESLVSFSLFANLYSLIKRTSYFYSQPQKNYFPITIFADRFLNKTTDILIKRIQKPVTEVVAHINTTPADRSVCHGTKQLIRDLRRSTEVFSDFTCPNPNPACDGTNKKIKNQEPGVPVARVSSKGD